MTICIAALCEDRKSIVLAADRMVSNYLAQVETGVTKIMKVHDRWWAMLAGSEPGQIVTMLDDLKAAWEFTDYPSPADVERDMVEAFRSRRDKKAEATWVLPLGMNLQEFLVSRQYLGDQSFDRTLANIQAIRLDCWVILCGFDEKGLGHVLSVETPGYVTRHDIPGCFAIGSGTTNATVSMYFRGQDYTASLPVTAYQVYEAKAFASVAPGVGSLGTEMMVLSSKNESVDGRSLIQTEIDALDAMWRAQSDLPSDLDQKVSAILSVK